MPAGETSPTSRALLVLELVQNSPGITADRLARRLGVTDRAVRRYVGILREAGVPLESTSGRYGGYRVGRGLRVPPLMFTIPEALGLVMAVLKGHGGDPADPVSTALDKIIRVLPEPVARPAGAVRRVSARAPDPDAEDPSAETTTLLVEAATAGRRLRLAYRTAPDRERGMDVDPWAVVVRHGRWYLLCWSHTAAARRVLRVDRIASMSLLEEGFAPPDGLDAAQAVEEHLSEGWQYAVEVVVEAPLAVVAEWVPRSLGRLEALGPERTRLVATTDAPDWYAPQLLRLRAPYRILTPPELQAEARALGQRLLDAAGQ